MRTKCVSAVAALSGLVLMGLPCPASAVSVGAADPYNVFVIGDIGSAATPYSSEFGGIAGVGGNAYFEDFTANSTDQSSPYGIYVNGDLSFNRGDINGGFTAGDAGVITQTNVFGNSSVGGSFVANQSTVFGSLSIPNTNNATLNNSTVTGGILAVPYVSPISYTTIANSLISASQSFSSLVPTGTVVPVCGSGGCTLFINGVSGQNVFDVDLDGFQFEVGLINFTGASDATFILDLLGSNISLQAIGFSLAAGIGFTDILWNLASATSATISEIGLPGTVLAPFAAVNFTNASIDGNLYAASLTGDGETHAVVPEPGTWALLLTGMFALFVAQRRGLLSRLD